MDPLAAVMPAALPVLTPLRRIAHPLGDIQHGMKAGDDGYAGFGEAYFTRVLPGAIKGWKRHSHMQLNLLVPCGAIRFYVRDDSGRVFSFLLGDEPGAVPGTQYARLTVPPGWWVAFEGVGPALNQLLNLASIAHDPLEASNVALSMFPLEIPA
jgi:dTDP-4-dehydrorhamnose 3,5-epimerase